MATRYNSPWFYARTGEIETAINRLEGSIAARAWIDYDPDLIAIRDHPRYRDVINSLPE
jgi:hypothetical protein